LADQESEDVIDAGLPPRIGSCGHDDCDDCENWITYPQSLFGNWTIKPVRKCGIERVVKNHEQPSTIYRADVLDSGVFGPSAQFEVSAKNKGEYWRSLVLGVSIANRRVYYPIVSDPAFSVRLEYAYVRCSWIRCQVLSCKSSGLGGLHLLPINE
jgi:hypothetical protein